MSAPPEWVFFTDRDLGAHIFPGYLRAAGLRVERHADHFAHDADDDDWLPQVAQRDWVILSNDQRMLRRPIERDAVIVSGARLLILIGANAKAVDLATNFVNTRALVFAFLVEHAAPYIAKVYRPSSRSVSPGGVPGRIAMRLTLDEWRWKHGESQGGG